MKDDFWFDDAFDMTGFFAAAAVASGLEMKLNPDEDGVTEEGAGAETTGAKGSCAVTVDAGVKGAGADTCGGDGAAEEDIPKASKSATNPTDGLFVVEAVFAVEVMFVVATGAEKSNKSATGAGAGTGGRAGGALTGGRVMESGGGGGAEKVDGGGPDNGTAVATAAIPPVVAPPAPLSSP
jgi:hypothetical protein